MLSFRHFGKAVARQFKRMSAGQLFTTAVGGDELWERYLESFPADRNPIYRKRREHDCSCCRHFIKILGGVVSIADTGLISIWDIDIADSAYQQTADVMSSLVKMRPVKDIFLHCDRVVGTAKSFEQLLDGSVQTWEHFHVMMPDVVVIPKKDIPTRLGELRSTHDVFERSLQTISLDAIDTTLDLIAQNSLYRGQEQRFAIEKFREFKVAYDGANQALFPWQHLSAPQSVTRIRNTAIGTLLINLSEGLDIESAVRKFEAVMAPANYKRPTALVTKAMIEKARKTIEDLGLTSALERRYATIDDITANNVLFADREARKEMNVFDQLTAEASVDTRSYSKVEEITITSFLENVLPRAKKVEVLFENRHIGNLVSLIASADPTAAKLFKWDNQFSWSYIGDVADSIKERVKKAGGNVTGDLCCRLAWDYKDDLDFHMVEPNGYRIYYGNRREISPGGGMLDLDANGADGFREDPAENIVYNNQRTMKEGEYQLTIHNFNRRSDGRGFEVEIEFDGHTMNIAYDKILAHGATITVAKIRYSKADGLKIIESLPSTQTGRVMWGLSTQTFQRARIIMNSPNYWDGQVGIGNQHYFFMLDGCMNAEKARGFYNEFLSEAMTPHRKVLEMVGAKLRTDETDRQLSGLGFSSTQHHNLLVRVTGAITRTLRVTF